MITVCSYDSLCCFDIFSYSFFKQLLKTSSGKHKCCNSTESCLQFSFFQNVFCYKWMEGRPRLVLYFLTFKTMFASTLWTRFAHTSTPLNIVLMVGCFMIVLKQHSQGLQNWCFTCIKLDELCSFKKQDPLPWGHVRYWPHWPS